MLDHIKSLRGDLNVQKNAIQKFGESFEHLFFKLVYSELRKFMKKQDQKTEEVRAMYFNEYNARKKLQNEIVELKGNIRVFCRVRPLLGGEKNACLNFDAFYPDRVYFYNSVHDFERHWDFNQVLLPSSTQEEVFGHVMPFISSFMDGYNVCIFAYGQTGSGKTFTMEGPSNDRGVYFRSVHEMMNIAKTRAKDYTYAFSLSLIEIYNDKIRDLLASE